MELPGRILDAWRSARAGSAALTPQRRLAIAALASRNIVPIVGIVFLDWRAPNILILYFIDFVIDVGACLLLLMLLDPEAKALMPFPTNTVAGRIKTVLSFAWAVGLLAAMFGFVFGLPVFIAFAVDNEFSLGALFADTRFRSGLLTHVLLSSWTYFQAYQYFSRMRQVDDKVDVRVSVKGRFYFVMGRWFAVYATAFVLPFFPVLLVAAYCVATVYFELFPQRLQKFFDPPAEKAPVATLPFVAPRRRKKKKSR